MNICLATHQGTHIQEKNVGIEARFFLDLAIIWEYIMGWFLSVLVSEAGVFFKTCFFAISDFIMQFLI